MSEPVQETTPADLDPLDFQGVLMAVQCGDVSTGWARDALRQWLAGKGLPTLPPDDVPNPFGLDDSPAEVCIRQRDALRIAVDALNAYAGEGITIEREGGGEDHDAMLALCEMAKALGDPDGEPGVMMQALRSQV